MACAHCAYSCTAKGKDMTAEIYRVSIDLCADYGDAPALGGGEPTLHPEFWQFIGYALSKDFDSAPWLATNGKRTEDALALARLARSGTIGVALSQDAWHEPIDERVVRAFTREQRHGYGDPYPNDYREIRNVKEPYRAGRWKDGPRKCVCPDLVINPDGTILQCGCMDAPKLGHVRDGIDGDWMTHECWQPEDEKVRAA